MIREPRPQTLEHQMLGLNLKITHCPSLVSNLPSNHHTTRRLRRLLEYVYTSTVRLNWKTNLHNLMHQIEAGEENGRRNLMTESRRKVESERKKILKVAQSSLPQLSLSSNTIPVF